MEKKNPGEVTVKSAPVSGRVRIRQVPPTERRKKVRRFRQRIVRLMFNSRNG
jgi:hypothetical protein